MNLTEWRQEYSHVFQAYNSGSRGSRSVASGAAAYHEPDAEGGFDYESRDFTKYGGETTSFGFALYGQDPAETEFIIIDQGTGVIELVTKFILRAAQTAASLGLKQLKVYCLQTHFHKDHTDGLVFNKLFLYRKLPVRIQFFSPDLRPYKRPRADGMSVYSNVPLTKRMMMQAFSEDEFPVDESWLTADISHQEFTVGDTLTLREDLKVKTCALPHPGGCCGYRIERFGYEPFTYMSDCDFGSQPEPELIDFMTNPNGQHDIGIHYHDLQFLNTQYDGQEPTNDGTEEGTILPRGRTETNPGWGHNCPRNLFDAIKRCRTRPRKILCGHHDPGHDDIDLDQFAKCLRKEARRRQMDPKKIQLARGLGKTKPKVLKIK